MKPARACFENRPGREPDRSQHSHLAWARLSSERPSSLTPGSSLSPITSLSPRGHHSHTSAERQERPACPGPRQLGSPLMPPKAKELLHQANSLNPTLQTAPRSLTPAPRPPHCPQQGEQPASLLGGSNDPPKPHVHRKGVPKASAADGRCHQVSCPSLCGHCSKAQQHSHPKLESQRLDPVLARRPSSTAAHCGDNVCNLKRDSHQGHQVHRKGADQCAGSPRSSQGPDT